MNVTDMKNWAARTYEDCLQVSRDKRINRFIDGALNFMSLQCCYACLKGLLPEPENSAILRFVYILCLWHGLAKCRQHTDVTLKLLEATTERLGDELRGFETYTATFDTYETPKEAAARERRATGNARKGKQNNGNDGSGRRRKRFSLRTVKIHLLGHYVPTIRRFGSTDSYSTQVVSHPVAVLLCCCELTLSAPSRGLARENSNTGLSRLFTDEQTSTTMLNRLRNFIEGKSGFKE